MDIRFKIDPNRMTLGDRIALEEAAEGMTSRQQRDLLARHMVDDNDEFLDFREACKLLNGLTMDKLNEIVVQFGEAIAALSVAQIPPA